MAEFDDKLNALLSNPDSMAQIMQLAQSLSASSPPTVDSVPQSQPDPVSESPPPPPASQSSSASILSSLPSGFDPKLIAKFLPVLQELNTGQSSDASKLLFALRPYLKEERQAKVERALQLARLIHIGKKFLTGGEG